jgi:hypothetical protein
MARDIAAIRIMIILANPLVGSRRVKLDVFGITRMTMGRVRNVSGRTVVALRQPTTINVTITYWPFNREF